MKVGIIGNYGATNIGDEAILTSILRCLPDKEVVVFSAHPENWEKREGVVVAPLFPLGLRSLLKFGFRRSIRALKKVDVMILGGGGLFQDSYLYACFLWAWQIFWVRFYKKPLFVYATGVGPLKTGLGQRLTRWAFHQTSFITVRDDYSHHLLKSIGVKKEIQITADPVFGFHHDKNERERTKNLFIISLRPWLSYRHQVLEAFTEFLTDLKAKRGAEMVFVSMQSIKESDLAMIKPLLKKVGGELKLVKDFSELVALMEKAEMAIGMRYHFMIAAILTGTPLIPVSYSPKTDSLFEETPLKKYLIKFDDLTPYKLNNTFREIESKYEEVVLQTEELSQIMASKAEKNQFYLQEFLSAR